MQYKRTEIHSYERVEEEEEKKHTHTLRVNTNKNSFLQN